MTIYTAKEIIQTKNALDLFRNFVITGDSGGAAMTFPVERAAETLLQLITGKHPDYVVVPREPTHAQLSAYYETIHGGQDIYEDAGSCIMRRIKAFMTGKPQMDHDHITYKALIQAAQEGQE